MDTQSTPTPEILLTPRELRERWKIGKKHLTRLHSAGKSGFALSWLNSNGFRVGLLSVFGAGMPGLSVHTKCCLAPVRNTNTGRAEMPGF